MVWMLLVFARLGGASLFLFAVVWFWAMCMGGRVGCCGWRARPFLCRFFWLLQIRSKLEANGSFVVCCYCGSVVV